MIKTESLSEFTKRALLENDVSVAKFEDSNKVIELMLKMFTKLHQINEFNMPLWVEVLISAAYVHNIFYDGTLTGIFAAREKLMPLVRECQVPVNAASLIFQAVEGQLGVDMPVESCVPREGTPNSVFAWSCWYVEELNGEKALPDCGAF